MWMPPILQAKSSPGFASRVVMLCIAQGQETNIGNKMGDKGEHRCLILQGHPMFLALQCLH